MNATELQLRNQPENIPEAMRHYGVWAICGGGSKAPRRLDHSLGSTTDPSAWYSFEAVRHALETDPWVEGIGIILRPAEPRIFAADFDKVVTIEGQRLVIDPKIQAHIAELASYTEYSRSWSGIHVFGLGILPPGRRRKANIELYDRERFMIVTGNRVPGTHPHCDPRQEQINALHTRVFGTSSVAEKTLPSTEGRVPAPSRLDDRELLIRAMRASNGDRFGRLWSGDTSAHAGDHSAADLALCSHLAFWTGGDPARVDRLFRLSGLMRSKWDERHYADGTTYGQRTVEVATSATKDTYGV